MEYSAGFYLVQCDSAERAREIAGRIPEKPGGVIEVRPVMDRRGWKCDGARRLATAGEHRDRHRANPA